ncbi:MAG: hypothetical protein WAW96_04390 [Alphaproteobacteria bacterium]
MADDKLTDRLRTAAKIVEDAGVANDLRSIAFKYVLEILQAPELPLAPERPADPGAPIKAAPSPADRANSVLSRIAQALGVDQDPVARVYEEDDGQVRLILKRGMLPQPDRKAASMRHIALLVVVGRQAAQLEEYTSYDAIREECRELNVYDRPNFAAEVARLEFRTRGGRNSKEAKANRHHFEEAADLLIRLNQEVER